MENKQLALIPTKAADVNGHEMGVLPDGTPYLTARSLAVACGVAPSVILTLDGEWSARSTKPRDVRLRELMHALGYGGERLYVKAMHKSAEANCHPDAVCMAILEYYAFEAGGTGQATALRNYRSFARFGLRELIYKLVGYDPNRFVVESFKHFQDRMLLNNAPSGYFSVFAEAAVLVLPAIQNGLRIDEHMVPDVSIGKAWGAHWTKNDLDKRFAPRVRYPHMYPDYYPQAAANGAIEPWVYPLVAVAEFRVWLESVYLREKFPSYVEKKVTQGALDAHVAASLLEAMNPDLRALPPNAAR